MTRGVTLEADGMRAVVLPDLGASLARLDRWQDGAWRGLVRGRVCMFSVSAMAQPAVKAVDRVE